MMPPASRPPYPLAGGILNQGLSSPRQPFVILPTITAELGVGLIVTSPSGMEICRCHSSQFFLLSLCS